MKKRFDDDDFWMDFHVTLNSKSIGKVPKAKLNIVNPHAKKLPVESVYTCIDCVKPHGRKNVPIPIRRGQRNELPFQEKRLKIPHQNATPPLTTHKRFSHRMKRTTAITIFSTILTFCES